MKNIIVTTSVKTNLELNEEAQQLADDLRLKYIIRNKKTIKQLLSSVAGVLVVYKNKLSYFEDDSELFFHLDTTALKIKNSDNEPLVEIIKEENLIIPHPLIKDRDFVKIPLKEIAKVELKAAFPEILE